MCTNNLVTTLRDSRRAAKQAARLRLALRMELIELLQVYTDNLRLMSQEKGYVISGRSFVSVIRGNLERITMLDESIITAVMAAFSHNERIEALVAANGRPSGGAAYRLDPDTALLRDVRRNYRIGRQRVNAALAAIDGLSEAVAEAAAEPDINGDKAESDAARPAEAA